MATPIEGKDLMIFYGTTTKKACALANELKLTINHATKEISSKDSGIWTDLAKGKLKWTASSGGLVAYDANAQSYEFLYDAMILREPVTLTFAIASGSAGAWTVDSTKDTYIGQAFIESLDLNAPDADNASYTISLSGTGALTKTNGA